MRSQFILHSALAPDMLGETLRRSIDEEQRTILSLSGYRGSSQILGVVTQNTFRLQRRRYWRNDFAPCLYGQFCSDSGGTRIEAHFDLSPWTKGFMRFWLIGVTVLGGPIFVMCLIDLVRGSHFVSGDPRVGLIVPPALLLWGFVLPKIGRLFGTTDEAELSDFLQHVLAARIDYSTATTTSYCTMTDN